MWLVFKPWLPPAQTALEDFRRRWQLTCILEKDDNCNRHPRTGSSARTEERKSTTCLCLTSSSLWLKRGIPGQDAENMVSGQYVKDHRLWNCTFCFRTRGFNQTSVWPNVHFRHLEPSAMCRKNRPEFRDKAQATHLPHLGRLQDSNHPPTTSLTYPLTQATKQTSDLYLSYFLDEDFHSQSSFNCFHCLVVAGFRPLSGRSWVQVR